MYCGCLQCTKQLLQPRLDSKPKVSASADGDALEQHFPSSAHDAYGSKGGSVVVDTAKFLKIFNRHVARCTLCYRTGRTHLFSRLTDSCYQNKFAPNVTHQPTYGLRFFQPFFAIISHGTLFPVPGGTLSSGEYFAQHAVSSIIDSTRINWSSVGTSVQR